MNLVSKMKIKYSLIGLIVVPIFGRLALSGTGHEGDVYRYLIPALVGCTAGLLIGRERGRYIVKQRKFLESQEHFRSVADNTQLLVCRFRPGYVITYANESYCKYFGKTSEELIGSSFLSLIPEPDREKVMANISMMTVDSPNQSHEHQVFGPNGESRWTRWTNRAQFDAKGQANIYQSIGEDITERKQAEEAVWKSEKQLRQLTDMLPQSICEVNKVGVITYANQSAFKSFGYTEADFASGLNFIDMLTPHERDRGATIGQSLMQGNIEKTTGNEYTAQRKDGSTFPVLIYSVPIMEAGKPVGLRSLLVDISERKEAEEVQGRLLAAIEQSGETFVITDAGATIQYVNPAFEQITGYTREEAIGQNPRILQSGEHDQAFYKKMWDKLLRGEVWRGHIVNKKKDGTLFEEDATISPVKNTVGQITNFVGVKRDVSREISLKQQLQQSQKMESIGTLAGGIAHDFNNILTAILGYAEIAKYDIPTDSKANKIIDKVISAGERAADLVQQILTFSRKNPQNLQSLMPSPIVKDALKLLRSSLPTTTRIEEDIDFECGFIQADPTQIHQIVLNLCTNAFQSLKNEKGTISVKLYRTEIAAGEITGESGVSAGPFIVLSVRDTGSGIDQVTIERIFEPYFTTKEFGDGTGLGLAVVHGIVKSYRGFIRAESELGEGATFYIYIPAMENAVVILNPTEEDKMPPSGTERILVVDDEDTILELHETILRQFGYEVTAASCSREALDKIRTHPDQFDLIITDQSMPNLSGAELAQKVLKIKPHMPIIICTGYSSVFSEEKALSMGIKKYIKKPVKQKELVKIVRQVLDAS